MPFVMQHTEPSIDRTSSVRSAVRHAFAVTVVGAAALLVTTASHATHINYSVFPLIDLPDGVRSAAPTLNCE